MGRRHQKLRTFNDWPLSWDKLVETVSKPVFVTLIGGVVIACVGGFFQYNNAKADRDAQDFRSKSERHKIYLQTLQDKRQKILGAFANDYENSMSLLQSLNDVDTWLADPKNQTSNAKDKFGFRRPKYEARKDELYKLYVAQAGPNPDLAQISALFSSPQVKSKLSEIRDSIKKIDNLPDTDSPEVKVEAKKQGKSVSAIIFAKQADELKKSEKIANELTQAMGDEIIKMDVDEPIPANDPKQ